MDTALIRDFYIVILLMISSIENNGELNERNLIQEWRAWKFIVWRQNVAQFSSHGNSQQKLVFQGCFLFPKKSLDKSKLIEYLFLT